MRTGTGKVLGRGGAGAPHATNGGGLAHRSGARTALVRTSRRRMRQLESLADRLAGLVGELV
ncbi:MAG TPA: hypothetical protein VIV88_01575 [Gemmatimonadales bacterium]